MKKRGKKSQAFKSILWLAFGLAAIAGILAAHVPKAIAADLTSPQAVCKDITVRLDSSGQATITAANVDGGSTDNFGIASMSVSPDTFTSANIGPNFIFLTVTDTSGNKSRCLAIVKVVKAPTTPAITPGGSTPGGSTPGAGVSGGSSGAVVTPPGTAVISPGGTTIETEAPGGTTTNEGSGSDSSIVCPGSITLDAEGAYGVLASNAAIQAFLKEATAVDAVKIINNAPKRAFGLGKTLVTFVATHKNRTTSSCTAEVKVVDTTPPAIFYPENIILEARGPEGVPASNPAIAAFLRHAAARDTVAGRVVVTNDVPNTFFGLGETPVTFTATDNSANTICHTAIVTVKDTIVPRVKCRNATVELDARGKAVITAQDINAGSSDTCGIAGMSISPSTFTAANIGNNLVTLTVIDTSGNVSACTATVLVKDKLPPQARSKDITVELDDSGTAAIKVADVDNGSSDNCGIASMSVFPSTFGWIHIRANKVTLTVIDTSGNRSSCQATVTVVDKKAPRAQCKDIIVQINPWGKASIRAAQVNDGSTDNCRITDMKVSPDTFTPADLGSKAVTLAITDTSGNIGTCTALVTLEDKIIPWVRCKSATVPLDASGKAAISVKDVDNGTTDNCGIASMGVSPNTFTAANIGSNSVTLTVTDTSGNVGTCTTTVIVKGVLSSQP